MKLNSFLAPLCSFVLFCSVVGSTALVAEPIQIKHGDSDPLSKRLLAQNDIFEANKNIETQMIEDADHFFRDFAIEDIVSDMIEEVQ